MMTQLAKFLMKYGPALDEAGLKGLAMTKKAGTAGLDLAKKHPAVTAGIAGLGGGVLADEALSDNEPTEEQVMEFLKRRGQM